LTALEFHVVYSKKQFGPDSNSSLTFEEAKKVSALRDSMTKLLDENYDKDDITNSLSEIRIIFGRGLALKQDMKVGDELLSENLTLKKPKGPLTWSDRELIIGKRAKHNLKSSVHLNLSDFN
jgi:N-acetylneuraminate synthase